MGVAHHDRAAQRSLRRTAGGAARIVGNIAAPGRRPLRLGWGTLPGETELVLPGDDLIAAPTWRYTHAIAIDAPPEAVWPWVVQLGQGRGGFYSYERLENLVGCRIVNADAVLPEHQAPALGDVVRLHPKAPPLHVAIVDPPRSFVLHGAPPGEEGVVPDNVWSFHVLPVGPDRCRLLERGITVHGTSFADRAFLGTAVIEPIGFVMGREMLRGIKERAEGS